MMLKKEEKEEKNQKSLGPKKRKVSFFLSIGRYIGTSFKEMLDH